MKIEIEMKTPDALDRAIRDAVVEAFQGRDLRNCEEDERFDAMVNEFTKMAKNWFQYGECITLELDTDNDTCIALRR